MRRKCAADWCDKPAKWRPSYSPLEPVFCTQRCAAEWAHEYMQTDDVDDAHEPH